MLPVSPSQILHELVARHGQSHESLQFATYISAYQYIKLYDLMTQYAPPGAKVLDWGTGSGHFSYYLVRSGYDASGFGFSREPLFCQEFSQPAYHYQAGSPEQPIALPFADATFDVVVSVGVLEHVRETGGDELASLKEIHRILKPGGHFLCYHFPNRHSWIEFLARRTERFSHPYLFQTQDIQTLVGATPLELQRWGRYALLPRNIWQTGLARDPYWGPIAGNLYNQLDWFLGRLLPLICQNYFFVARKPDHPTPVEKSSTTMSDSMTR